MKKKIIFCILICFTSYSYAQLVRYYSIDLPKYSSSENLSEYSLGFKLDENRNYEIYIQNYNTAIIMNYPISDGNYEIKNDTLILTDSYTQNQLLYKLDSSSVTPIKTYPFMKEIVFKDYYKIANIPKSINEKISIEKIVSDFETKNIQNNHLEEGIYADGIYFDIGFELKLKSDKKYEFNFKAKENDMLFSKLELYLIFSIGTWERKGNILLLWDTNFEHQFYGLIREDGIELLLFRWQDVIFRKDFY